MKSIIVHLRLRELALFTQLLTKRIEPHLRRLNAPPRLDVADRGEPRAPSQQHGQRRQGQPALVAPLAVKLLQEVSDLD